MRSKRKLAIAIFLVLAGAAGAATGSVAARAALPRPAEPDSGFLEQYAATFRFRLGRPASIQLTSAGDAVLFLRSGPKSFVQDLYEYDVAARRERVLLTAEGVLRGAAETLSP